MSGARASLDAVVLDGDLGLDGDGSGNEPDLRAVRPGTTPRPGRAPPPGQLDDAVEVSEQDLGAVVVGSQRAPAAAGAAR